MVGNWLPGYLEVQTWDEPTCQEFFRMIGKLRLIKGGKVSFGVDQDQLDEASLLQINCPGYSSELELPSFIITQELVSRRLFRWMHDVPSARRRTCDESLGQHRRFGFQNGLAPHQASMVLSNVGWQLPTEEQWERAVIGSNEDMSIRLSKCIQFASAIHLRRLSRYWISHSEFTRSLGFALDPRLRGDAFPEGLAGISLHCYPGVIVRGWSSRFPNPLSRFSYRFAHHGIGFRMVFEESALQDMDGCAFKDHMLEVREGEVFDDLLDSIKCPTMKALRA